MWVMMEVIQCTWWLESYYHRKGIRGTGQTQSQHLYMRHDWCNVKLWRLLWHWHKRRRYVWTRHKSNSNSKCCHCHISTVMVYFGKQWLQDISCNVLLFILWMCHGFHRLTLLWMKLVQCNCDNDVAVANGPSYGVFTMTEIENDSKTDKNGLYRIVWRCS